MGVQMHNASEKKETTLFKLITYVNLVKQILCKNLSTQD